MIEEHERWSSPPAHPGTAVQGAPALVVALGGSAGGLDALREFFGALDEGAGMAFVVIAHQVPEGKSLLPNLLQQATQLPVREIEHGQTLAPDHVYVAPPDALVQLEAAAFALAPLLESDDRRTPIDTLFRSLAHSFGPRAVGVVLSGAGTDGTVGVQEIANAGGMTLAQDPEQARFDSMPRSAIATGVIDHVLRAQQLANELLAYVGHVIANEQGGTLPDAAAIVDALPEICDLLERATDHNFKHYKTTTLTRRIQRRIQVLRLPALDAYLTRLREDADELTQLFRELLIGVTAFFRDPAAFESLTREVLHSLLDRRGEPLRFWVPGCATGEEAYSLAMLVLEALDGRSDPPDVQIFATDIDERALSAARQGVYPAGIAEDVSPERLERFFVRRGKRYQVTKEVRALCVFSPHNLINDPPFSRLDLISCRNLLIYFGPHLQTKLVPLFHYALRSKGYLFLGPSENISAHKELFAPVNAKQRIYQRKPTAIRSSAALANALGYRGMLRGPDPNADSNPDLHQVMQRILLDEFAPKSVIVTQEGQIVCASGDMERYLTVSEGTFQNNVIRLARPGLRVGLRAALQEAIAVRRKITHDNVSLQLDSGIQRVRVTVQPMPRLGEEADLFMVVFQDAGGALAREEAGVESVDIEANTLIEQLEHELASTRQDLEKTIQDLEAANEELKSSNEELLSMNEELQSANEELETSKEEVQASNDALARAHANLSNLLTSTAIATIFLDEELRVQSYTPAVSEIYNVLPADVGRPLEHITHRASEMPPLPDPSELRARPRNVEDQIVCGARVFSRRVVPYQTHEGRREGLVVTFLDVTELTHAESRARDHEQQLQTITDALPVLISYVDAELRYRFNNFAYEQWFETSRADMQGKPVRDVLGAEAFAQVEAHMLRALRGEAVSFDAKLAYRRDFARDIHADYVPDIARDGSVRGFFALITDITERRTAAEALRAAKRSAEQANRAKSDFLANMSHEIRTPMTAILGYADLLQRHVSDPDNLACIGAIKRNGQHLVELINDILDLSKIEAGMLGAERVRFSPSGVLREVVEGLRVRAAERGLSLELSYDGPMPASIESDPTRLRQIMINLIGNAVKFTNQGGVRVIARLRRSEQLLEVRVVDTGIGISRELRSRLFEPFTQADTSVTRQYGGTGLGLTICKRLAELLGGSIWFESEQGRGSTFGFSVATGALDAVALADPPAVAPLSSSVRSLALGARKVLVVDDRRDMRYLVQSYLEEAQAEVLTAADGVSALQCVERLDGRLDAIVLDMQMPVMDGYEAARRLRQRGYRGTIIALTASAMKGDRERCLAAGCDTYLTKPVERTRLLEAIVSGFEAPHAGQGARNANGDGDAMQDNAANGGGRSAAAQGGEVPMSTAPASSGPGSGSNQARPRRVLIVDDNEDATEALAMLMEAQGFAVWTASTGAAAIERAQAERPDAIVLDLGLPDLDGYEVIAHLKPLAALRGTMFVALTGRSLPQDLERIKQAGFDHQFVKPPDLDRLIDVLRAPS